jgi:uncharacterized protein DUF3105
MTRRSIAQSKLAFRGFSPSAGQVIVGATIVLTVVIIAAVFLSSASKQIPGFDPNVPDNSVSYPDQGRTHIADGASHIPYDSNPPSSGPHYGSPAPWAIYDQIVPDEVAVHNLEHGGIWITYRDQSDTNTINQLKDIAGRFDDHIIMSPRPADDSPIALAAWGYVLKLDSVDAAQIYNFIDRFRLHGPENV